MLCLSFLRRSGLKKQILIHYFFKTINAMQHQISHCAPACCRSSHTRLIDDVQQSELSFVNLTPTDYLLTSKGCLPIFSGCLLVEITHERATIFHSQCGCLDFNHILCCEFAYGSPHVSEESIKSRCPFVPAAWKLLDGLSEMGFCAAPWKSTKWNM